METKYNYKLIQQHMTSDRLGNCEICGEFVSDVYSQTRTHIKTIGGEGHEYNTVYIRCGSGQTRQVFFDPETFDIRVVEPRTGITAAKAIDEIRDIVSESNIADIKLYRIEEVLEEVAQDD